MIAHINICGLIKNLNEIYLLLQCTKLDMVALTETHLTDIIEDKTIKIKGYDIIHSDCRDRWGGGRALYYKDHLEAAKMPKYQPNDLEALWVEITLSSQQLLLGTVYKPPDQNHFYARIKVLLEQFCLTRKGQ